MTAQSTYRMQRGSGVSPLARSQRRSGVSPLARNQGRSGVSPLAKNQRGSGVSPLYPSSPAFTLIELMVASLLLGVLVMVLTMLFNTSSIAWRTGTAGVALLGDTRRELGKYHDVRDDVLPGVGDTTGSGDSRSLNYRTVSLWQKNSDQLRSDRAYAAVSAPFSLSDAKTGAQHSLEGGRQKGGSLFTVGVRSAGPNGTFGDEDDITTWPDKVF